MQVAHQRHHHDPPRLIRALLALGAALLLEALLLAPPANAAPPRSVALPSPTSALSASPPLAGGAIASAEATRHRISARTVVAVSVDRSGTPFRITATQRLLVHVPGDYSFTIGAPVLDVRAAPGSEREPGLRATSILWEGFNPGTRTLAATAVLRPSGATSSLPLRIVRAHGHVDLVNATETTASSFTADVESPPLRSFLDALGRAAVTGTDPLPALTVTHSAVRPATAHVRAALHVTGTIGAQHVDIVLGGTGHASRARFAAGPLDLTVDPVPPDSVVPRSLEGRALLRRAIAAGLEFARWRQYEQFLGNPDPSGPNRTTYRYTTSARPAAVAPVAAPRSSDGGASRGIALAVALLLAAAGAVALWARA